MLCFDQAAEERLATSELANEELRRELESRNSTIRWLEAQVGGIDLYQFFAVKKCTFFSTNTSHDGALVGGKTSVYGTLRRGPAWTLACVQEMGVCSLHGPSKTTGLSQ